VVENAEGRRGRPGPRPKYSTDDVLETALRLVDRETPDKFSLRRLAAELGLGVMTVYGYFRSREELLDALASYVFTQGDPTQPDAAGDVSWDVSIRRELHALHCLCRKHPHLVVLILGQVSPAPGMFRLRERILNDLLNGGLSEQQAVHALGVLASYVLGFSSAQAAHSPVDIPERLEELPAEEFPRLTAVAPVYSSHLSESAFEFGLDLLIRGLVELADRA
jgi:AcrR family transcriptional regulator